MARTEATKTIAAMHQIAIGLTWEARAVCICSGNTFADEGLVANQWIKDFFVDCCKRKIAVDSVAGSAASTIQSGSLPGLPTGKVTS